MPSIDRRKLVAGVVGCVSLAGCLDGDDRTETDSLPSTGSETPTLTSSSTPTGRLSLTPIHPAEVDGELTVLPENLQQWLRTAATTAETVRAHAGTDSYDPDPPLPAFERVELHDELGDADGTYDLDVEGDTRYRLHVGAEKATPPNDADVTPVSSLPEDRRTLAIAAIDGAAGDDARVSPETELGSWVRHDFFGGYVSDDQETYTGFERQQTDAEFYATNVWYVLSATAVDAPSAQITLRLAAVDDAVRQLIDDRREATDRPQSMEATVSGGATAAVRAFAEETQSLLTHDAVYRVAYDE